MRGLLLEVLSERVKHAVDTHSIRYPVLHVHQLVVFATSSVALGGEKPSRSPAVANQPRPQSGAEHARGPVDDHGPKLRDKYFPIHRTGSRDGRYAPLRDLHPRIDAISFSDHLRGGQVVHESSPVLQDAGTLHTKFPPAFFFKNNPEFVRHHTQNNANLQNIAEFPYLVRMIRRGQKSSSYSTRKSATVVCSGPSPCH